MWQPWMLSELGLRPWELELLKPAELTALHKHRTEVEHARKMADHA